MPAPSPRIGHSLKKILRELGHHLRNRRKNLGISAVATAEAAGMSRVTLYRIEGGEESVAMGAYLAVASALGLELGWVDTPDSKTKSKKVTKKKLRNELQLAPKICIADYPQLKKLAWQLRETSEICLKDALDLYERNWRHVDLSTMQPREIEFVQALLTAFGREQLLV